MKKLQLFLLGSLLTTIPQIVRCQGVLSPWAISVHAGISEYKGDMGNGLFQFNLKPTSFYDADKVLIQQNQPGISGLSISRFINEKWDLSFSYLHGEWGYYTPNKTSFFFKKLNHFDVLARYKIPYLQSSTFTPYLAAGFAFRTLGSVPYKMDVSMPIGVGVNVQLLNGFLLNFQSMLGYTSNDGIDGLNQGIATKNDLYLNHTIGIGLLPFSMNKHMFSKSKKSKCPKFK